MLPITPFTMHKLIHSIAIISSKVMLPFTSFCLLFLIPLFTQGQILKKVKDDKTPHRTVIYKNQETSDLDILKQLEDVPIGQEIQIAWEVPNRKKAEQEKKENVVTKKINPHSKKAVKPLKQEKKPVIISTKKPSIVEKEQKQEIEKVDVKKASKPVASSSQLNYKGTITKSKMAKKKKKRQQVFVKKYRAKKGKRGKKKCYKF